jgi:hypothetical protein
MARSDAERIFTRIYASNSWCSGESKSGPGSTVRRTDLLRSRLSELVSELGIRSLLDAPCGDFNWMRLTELPGVDYVGVDVVPELVRANTLLYGGPARRFDHIDMLRGPLPKADLVLCRDGLVHFSFSDIAGALRALKESGSTYLLVTTFTACVKNTDTSTGGWRPLNLDLAPFRFPPALRLLPDGPLPDGTYADKVLGLYRIQDLPDRLPVPMLAACQSVARRLRGVMGRALERTRRAGRRFT